MFKKVFAGISALAICAMSMPATMFASAADVNNVNLVLGTVSTTGAIVDGALAEQEIVTLNIDMDHNDGFVSVGFQFDINQFIHRSDLRRNLQLHHILCNI